MKGQTAMLEVLLCAMLLASTLGAYASVSYAISLEPMRLHIELSSSVYDLAGAVYADAGTAQCVAAPACAAGLLQRMRAWYGLGYIALASNNESVASGSDAACTAFVHECFATGSGNAPAQLLCAYACD